LGEGLSRGKTYEVAGAEPTVRFPVLKSEGRDAVSELDLGVPGNPPRADYSRSWMDPRLC